MTNELQVINTPAKSGSPVAAWRWLSVAAKVAIISPLRGGIALMREHDGPRHRVFLMLAGAAALLAAAAPAASADVLWDRPQSLSPTDQTASSPVIATAPDGTGIVVWNANHFGR